jgi:ATP-dependent exoDNAse (exonuclease V) beta subunit
LAYGYDAEATLRPRDFADSVERRPVEDPSAAAVRVMTVHQAKGLEFDAVFLPELDEELLGQPPNAIFWSDEPAGDVVGVLRYASKEVQEHLPDELRRRFRDRTVRAVREAYCLLYVALTRAKHALYLITAPSKPNERTVPKTFAGVLRAALGAEAPLEPGRVWFTIGDPNWRRKP